MAQQAVGAPAPTRHSRSSNCCDRFDRKDAPPLGVRRILTQACHDLYGTKDVQNAIMATYVWMADQIGHLTLGLVPTLLLCWILHLVWPGDGGWHNFVTIVLAGLVFSYWVYKELTDFHDTSRQARDVFPFDSSDIVWNVKTALLYFGIGGLLGLAAFLHWALCLLVFLLVLWPAIAVAYWWLRRKVAFQQAGLPYLYRLANFATELDDRSKKVISGIANLRNVQVGLIGVVLLRNKPQHKQPTLRHLLVTGPLGAGKTSLCVGVGTEFAFGLGHGRYLSAAKLVELAASATNSPDATDYDDGRILWAWNGVELLIVDDVDVGVRTKEESGTTKPIRLVKPESMQAALVDRLGPAPLRWLGKRRSVWVLGDPDGAPAWKSVIAALLGVLDEDILTVELGGKPAAPPGPPRGFGQMMSGPLPRHRTVHRPGIAASDILPASRACLRLFQDHAGWHLFVLGNE